MMKEVDTFFKKCKQDVKEFYSVSTQLQGPQGCVSSVFSDNVQTLLHTLQSLLKDYPYLKEKISTQAISTKPNESLHSLFRGRTLSPDAYEFGEILPKLVREHVLQCSKFKPFLYITNPKTYYERQECFINVELPMFPKRKSSDLTSEEITLIKEYQGRFLDGVRQNSIRNSHTKNKAGTLPPFCYGSKDPDPQPVNFDTLLNEIEDPLQNYDPPKTEVYGSGSVILTKRPNNSNSLADVFLAKLKSPVFSNMEDDDIVECLLYCNEINDVLVLNELDTTSNFVKVAELIREVEITSLKSMTQSEYSGFTAESNAIPLLTQRQEESQLQLDDWLIGTIGSRSQSGRSRGVPMWMRDENVVLNF